MDWSDLPAVLGGIGVAFGAYATFAQQRGAYLNKRFEMLFTMQGGSITELKAERDDFRARLTQAEALAVTNMTKMMECEQSKHHMELEIGDLKRTVDELRRIIPNGTAI